MGVETAAAIALAAESAAAASAATAAAAAGTAGAAAGAGALGATAAGAAGTAAATGAAGAAAGGLTAAEVAGGAIAAESAAAGGAAAAAGGVSPTSLAFANTVQAFGGDGLSALIAAEGGFGSTSTMMGAAGDMFAGTAVGDLAKSAVTSGQDQGQPAPAKPAANTGPSTPRPNQNPGLTQASSLMAPSQGGGQLDMGALLPLAGFQNGGQVGGGLAGMFPGNIFEQTRQRREQEAGLMNSGSGQGVTININSGGGSSGESKPKTQSEVPRSEAQTPGLEQFATQVLNLIRGETAGYADGGQVRSAASDIKAGGEIRGPQSKDGRDNQIIKVAGGEGILPVDVMEVPGIPELVQTLIKTFHTPLK